MPIEAPIDATVLYEDFLYARTQAMQLFDAYRDTAIDDPVQWERVVRQTERARQMLEAWLRSPQPVKT